MSGVLGEVSTLPIRVAVLHTVELVGGFLGLELATQLALHLLV